MIDQNHELLTAADVLKHFDINNGGLGDYLKALKSLGIDDAPRQLYKMLVCDYIISNRDRHFNNFGIIRNVETLNYVGVAPLYDNGNSFYVNVSDLTQLDKIFYLDSPFTPIPDVKLKLVTDFSWYDASKLDGFLDEACSAFANTKLMPDYIEGIIRLTKQRINNVGAVMNQQEYDLDPISLSWFKDIDK